MDIFVKSHASLPIVVLGFLLSAFVTLVGIIVHALYFSAYSHVPGPRLCKITRLWLAYHDIMLKRNEKIYKWHQQYGSVVLMAPGEVSFSGVSATREIYGSNGRHPKSKYFDHFLSYGGERATFNTLDYDSHKDKRKLTFAFFQSTSMYKPVVINPIRSRVIAFLDQVANDNRNDQTLDFFSRVNLYAFDNITRLLYGPRQGSHTIENKCQEHLMLEELKECEVWNNLLFNFPFVHKLVKYGISHFTGNNRFLTAEDKFTRWNTHRLSTAALDPLFGTDDSLLCRLQEMKTKNGISISRNWVAAEVLDNLNAAQTTVTVATTYVLWNIARNPVWQKQIRQELGQLPLQHDGMPSFADIDACQVLDACIKESYRVNPSSSGRAERVVPATKAYDGVLLPEGTIVSTSTIAIHRCPLVFADPETYNPSRWLQADSERLRAMEKCFIPFGYGAHLCLGKAFATIEVKMLIACLLLQYQICEDEDSATTVESMRQSGTQDALPRGLRCDLLVKAI
ncbi:MAG: hypothetical protein M1822_008985 [Bathelium mastoideum]|nr:MAG: hypothetical protein M1822_008985 [Bathelium mastoideum]